MVMMMAKGSTASRMPPQLQRAYAPGGKVGIRIRWGTPGDFTRCCTQARKHGMSDRQAKGVCAKFHKRYTGVWPGDARNVGRGRRVKR